MTAARTAVNAIVLAGLTALALAPLWSAYQSLAFWIAALGGIAVGTALAVVGARLRWSALSLAALTIVAFFVFGGVLVLREKALFGILPTLDVLTALALGSVNVWKDVLTLQAPFAGFDDLALAPYVLGLLVSVVAVSLGLRLRRAAWALVPIGLLLVFSIALSTYAGFAPGWVGAAVAVLALGWLVWRARANSTTTTAAAVIAAAAIVLVAGVAGAGAASAVSGAGRDVLRDHIVPPLELHDYASPLASFRAYSVDQADETLLTVTGVPAGTRVRLAALDLYDGIVYQVSGSGGAGAGVFARVGREIAPDASGEAVSVEIEIGELGGVWVPTVGAVTSVAAEASLENSWASALHYNAATDTAVVTTGLAPGDSYAFTTIVPATPSDDRLTEAEVARVALPAPAAVPAEVTALVDEVVAASDTPIGQLRALEALLQDGFFATGDTEVFSRSGHTASRLSEMLGASQMIGDDEQYAVAMALVASQLGIPARVVMGFTPETDGATTAVTGADLHAWVEVPFDGLGWVAFTPTPSEERVPQAEVPEQQQRPRAQVPQPPDSPQEPAELPPAPPIEEASGGDEPADWSWLWTTLQISGIAFVVLLALLGPSIALAIARSRRRRARRRASAGSAQVGGGWAELVDAAHDVGAPLTPGATRRESGRVLDDRFPEVEASALALRADIAVFGAADPTPAEVDAYWADVDTAVKRIETATPWHRRLRAALFPASVLRRWRGRR